MKVSVENVGGCRRILHIQAPAESVAARYEQVVDKFRRAAKIPGFRPGRAPVAVVEKRYADGIKEEARGALVPHVYEEAIKQEGIKPEAIVKVTDVDFDKKTGISIKVAVDFAPDFKLPKYKKIGLRGNEVAVEDAEVDKAFDQFLEQHARFEDVSGRAVQEGDLVNIDYSGECEGRAVKELDPSCAGLGEGTNFWTMAGPQELLPGLTEGLLGMEIGQEKTVEIQFPDDFRIKAIAGKTATYAIAVKNVRERIRPECTEEFLARFDSDSEESLREKIRAQLLEAARDREKDRLREEISQFLLKKTDFELPQAVVESEANTTARGMVQRMAQGGASEEQIRGQAQAIRNTAAEQASEKVKLSYVLGRIAETEGVEVEESELSERIAALSRLYRTSPAQLRSEMVKRGTLDELRKTIRERKTLDFLLENAKIKT